MPERYRSSPPHTHEGDAIGAARRLPMAEFDGTVQVTGADGPVPFLDRFQGLDELTEHDHGAFNP